jgi:serine/threonine protein kinase
LDYPVKAGDPDLLGDWKIVSRLGEGSQGVVYRATRGIQNAAIKLLKAELIEDPLTISRFKNEAQVLLKLSDPCIGKILDSNLYGEKIWIATEYINGPTLEEKVKLDKPLDELAFFRLASNIFHGLKTVHENGVVHRDVKPSNIVLGEKGDTKLIDFGISHLSGNTRVSTSGDFEGSRPFSAPENYTNKNIPAMDVFSAATTLAYAGTGKFIWKGETALQVMRSINEIDPDLSGLSELQVTFLKPMFAKNPSERPSAIDCEKRALKILQTLAGKKRINPIYLRIKYQSASKLKRFLLILSVFLISFIITEFYKVSYVFFTILFFTFPFIVVWIVYKTYKKGIGKSHWGKGKILKSIAVGLSSFILSLTILVTSVASSFIPGSVQDWFSRDTIQLSALQLQKISSCKSIAGVGDFKAAATICQEPAELGDVWAQYTLGFSLDELGNNADAVKWVLKAVDQKMPEALTWMAFDEIEKENYVEALEWAKQAADLGDLDGVNAVGLAYGYLEQYDLAVEWYKKSWELGDILGAINLGYHYRFDSIDKIKAAEWLKIAAETNSVYEGETAFDYAEFLRIDIKNSTDACKWYKKSSDLKYKEENEDGIESYKNFCSKKETVLNPVESALLSSNDLKISSPLASTVKTSEIFGRVFKDSEMIWRVILTNSSTESVPPINGIQFRLVGYEEAGWVSLPYKLKKDSRSNSVYAAVDDLFLSVLFKKPVCPEFRAVREENGKLVNIWNKGKPECSNDYLP